MKKIFDDLSYQFSKRTTQQYSTSFSLGILALHKSIRTAIYNIYAYVRLADEVVDSFHDYNKKALLHQLKTETFKAIENKISLNPILNSFQATVNKYNIDQNLINSFLQSMEMDLENQYYTSLEYNNYIWGSAEVVGLMCLQVFVGGDVTKFTRLKPYAMKLGSAFQKINFLRDCKNDYELLGRTYFPDVNFKQFNNHVKKNIEKEIEVEFKEALMGIKSLPHTSKFGVYIAYKYYWHLFKKVQKKSAQQILQHRIRIPNTKKISIIFKSFIAYKFSAI